VDQARSKLVEAFQHAELNRNQYWPGKAWSLLKLREAEQLIEGDTDRIEKLLAEQRQAALAAWERREQATEAFDHLVATFSAAGTGDEPDYPYLARGRRLADLGRLDEAEADFNKAVELAPENPQTLAARARFLAERGEIAKAQADYDALLTLVTPRGDLRVKRYVEREIGLNEAVLDDWRRREPRPYALGRISADRLLRRGEWREAAAAYVEAGTDAFHEQHAAGLYCLLADRQAYDESCARHAALVAGKEAYEYSRLFILGLWPGAPNDELTQFMEARLPIPDEQGWRRFPVGLALYRHGRYAEAERELNRALAGQSAWQYNARFWPVLAMICWQTGRQEEAREWLRRCDWWAEFLRPGADIPNEPVEHVNNHFEWLATHILCREAKALIEGPPR
jgi:tetratricopeptide (TPR) repeat protein